MKRALTAVAALVALVVPAGAQAFTPNDPLAPRQWYLAQDKTFNAFELLPPLPEVRVGVIDTGVDLSHPELRSQVVASRSFVGGTANDTTGHGTFVAGEIAAAVDNGRGIAGLSPSARLLIAKVVGDDGTVSPSVEAQAIRWVVARGARVVNVSLGGVRDPQDGQHSGFSPVEQRAIDYAVAQGALVVASVGNNPYGGGGPWPFAGYPAALPHVLGVGSFGRDGDVSSFSNRDDRYVDLVAPGEDMFSLLPRALTAKNVTCVDQGYSDCGPKDFRHASGTSFSAAQVSAAAAMLFALAPWPAPRPGLGAARALRDARDSRERLWRLPAGRDALSGWGRLDIAAAVHALRNARLPVRDRFEPDDNVSLGTPIRKPSLRVRATARLLGRSQRRLSNQAEAGPEGPRGREGSRRGRLDRPLEAGASLTGRCSPALRARRSVHGLGVKERLRYRAAKTGWYSLQVVAAKPGAGAYTLRVTRR